jgi:hypothetical protein
LAKFGEKIDAFLKNQFNDEIYSKISSILLKNGNIFAKYVGENILRIGPRIVDLESTGAAAWPTSSLQVVKSRARAIFCCLRRDLVCAVARARSLRIVADNF